jgi:hypothetical protein
LEWRKRKKTNVRLPDFRHYALECRNVGMVAQRKREREVATRKPCGGRLKRKERAARSA